MRLERAAIARRTAIAVCVACVLGAAPPRRAPLFQGDRLPDPPRQGDPWKPPASRLPRFLVEATATLFDQGVADPRGGEYCEIEVGVGQVWSGSGGIVRTRGWVMPAEDKDGKAPRFAVCWNGLMYPTLTIGAKADLAADVRAIVAGPRGVARPGRSESRWASGGYGAFGEGAAVSAESLMPLKVCMLLRLGEAGLAEALWTAGSGKELPGPGRDLTDYGVSYASLAADWAWGAFDRTICAHMRGDDRIALAGAHALDRFQKAFEIKADAMGFARPVRSGPGPSPYLDFLAPLPAILADQERRAKEPERGPVPGPGGDKPARIAALIRDLDQVAARQSGQPGGIGLGEDAIVQDLIKEGEDAVEPLLPVLESDDRLTRSVSFHRDFFRGRTTHGVHEAAFIALGGILRTTAFGGDVRNEARSGDPAARKRLAAAIRAYWERNKGLALTDRWYRTLADDEATPGQWHEAAALIIQPADYETTFGSVWITVPRPRRPGEVVKLKGDPLRDRNAPSVTELMVRRVGSIARANAEGDASQMALLLARWDKAAAAPLLRDQFRLAREREARESTVGGRGGYGAAATLVQLTDARVRDGDPEALGDYAAWLRGTTPKANQQNLIGILEPMSRHPRDPAIAAAAGAMFDDPKSPWLPLVNDKAQPGLSYLKDNLIGSGLVGVAAFRRRLLVELKDRTVIGKASPSEQGASYTLEGGGSGGSGPSFLDPDGPAPGGQVPIRVCDWVAWKLGTRVDGIAPCELFWPEARRDAAVAACAEFLERYGERLADAGEADLPPDYSRPRIGPLFPKLDHPATADDVRKGLAIFSLEGEGQARTWPLPARPIKARWTTLKDYGYMQQYADIKTGKAGKRLAYDQEGQVWQAEEVLKEGRWERYYGFVGRRLARVPASEMEFPEDWYSWGALSGPIDCRVSLPGAAAGGLAVGRPIVVALGLRNRSGLEREVPTDLYHPDGPALRCGLALALSFAATDAAHPSGRGGAPPEWEDLAPRITGDFAPGDARRALAPAESFEAGRLDLNDWFPITRPGLYRLRLTVRDDSGLGEGSSNEVSFPVAVPPAKAE